MKAEKFEMMLAALEAASEQLEKVADITNLTPAQAVDIGARIRLIKGKSEKVDKALSEIIKDELDEKNGELKGSFFVAAGKNVPVERFDSKAFKEARPKLYDQYLADSNQYRITYQPR